MQDVFAPIDPPVSEIVPAGVWLKVPPHAGVVNVPMVSPAGTASVRETPETAVALGLVITNVRTDGCPTPIILGAKDLVTVSGFSGRQPDTMTLSNPITAVPPPPIPLPMMRKDVVAPELLADATKGSGKG